MIVGFDISQIAYKGGVATYTKNLARCLLEQDNINLKFFYSSLRKPLKENFPNVRNFPIPQTLLEILFNRIRVVPIEAFIGRIDVYHSSDWTQPPTRARKVTTYHDLIPIKYPEWSNPKIVAVHKRRLAIVEKEVDMVITVSESTKKDLLEVSKIPENRIRTIYEAASEVFTPKTDDEVKRVKRKFSIKKKYVFSVVTAGARKNTDNLFSAFELLKRDFDLELVIAGTVFRNKIQNNIVHVGFVDDYDLACLYTGAEIFVLPSFYEGFGLPVLEAMSCGTPVAVSQTSSLPEIAGEHAAYFNPADYQDIYRVMIEILNLPVSKRGMLVAKLLKQASKFSWQKTVSQTLSLYREVINN